MPAKITKRAVDVLPPGKSLADSEIKGFIVRRLPSGVVSFGYRYRNTARAQRWLPLGIYGSITAEEARGLAKRAAGDVAHGRDPQAERDSARTAAVNTVDKVLDGYLNRSIAARKLRSGEQIASAFDRLVRPRLGKRSIYSLGRGDIIDLLDLIEDESGPVMADRTLAYLRAAFNWYAVRDQRFNSPIIRGMARTKRVERARARILTDEEIRLVWSALDELPPVYAALLRCLLWTGQRRDELRHSRWESIEGALLTIPAARYKGKVDHVVPLVPAVEAELARIGTRRGAGFIFSQNGSERPIGNLSTLKHRLDAAVERRHGRPLPQFQLHDLRRTARTLMSRAGVGSDIAERVLGHRMPGVRGTYNRFEYLEEKRDALGKLAALIERILHPDTAVVAFPKRPA